MVILSEAGSPLRVPSIAPKRSAEELELDLKELLNKLKIRRAPKLKVKNERHLRVKLVEKKALLEKIQELQRSVEQMSRRVGPKRGDSSTAAKSHNQPQRIRFAQITQEDVDKRKEELEEKKRELANVRASIAKAKKIIRNPYDYVSVPSDYGALPPEEVQRRERQLLYNDRVVMERMVLIIERKISAPYFLVDKW